MKILVATDKGKWVTSDIFECDVDEIVIFPLFQSIWNINKDEIFMQGITTCKNTTTVTVKKMNIPYAFYKELIRDSIEAQWNTWINDKSKFTVNDVSFNLDDIIDELIDKSSEFKEGEIIKIDGRQLYAF